MVSMHKWRQDYHERGESRLAIDYNKFSNNALREALLELPKPAGWTILPYQSSLSFKAPKNKLVIKVNSDLSIFVERKVNAVDWKSTSILCKTREEVVEKTRELLQHFKGETNASH